MKAMKSFVEKNAWIWALAGCVILWMIIALNSTFSIKSVTTILYTTSFLVIIALGQMTVVTTGRGAIDLSIPDVITLTAFLSMGIINGQNARLPLGILAVLGVCVAVGLFNSFLVIVMKIPPMLATMGTGYILETFSLFYNNGFSAFNVCSILKATSRTKILELPLVIYIVIAIVVGVLFVYKKTTFGRAIAATGQNLEAAKLAGINTVAVEVISYIFCAICGGLVGILLTAKVGSAFLGMGDSYLMETVGAVVIGGTLISGGKAVPIGTAAGALFLSLIITTMQIAGAGIGLQNVAKGALIILVILIGAQKTKKA